MRVCVDVEGARSSSRVSDVGEVDMKVTLMGFEMPR